MEYLFTFLAGLIVGWFLTWFWYSIRARWNRSQNLRQASSKTLKENVDRAKKARQDRAQARRTALRAVVEAIVLVGAIVAAAWFIVSLLS